MGNNISQPKDQSVIRHATSQICTIIKRMSIVLIKSLRRKKLRIDIKIYLKSSRQRISKVPCTISMELSRTTISVGTCANMKPSITDRSSSNSLYMWSKAPTSLSWKRSSLLELQAAIIKALWLTCPHKITMIFNRMPAHQIFPRMSKIRPRKFKLRISSKVWTITYRLKERPK